MEKMCYCIIRAVQQYSDTDEHHQGGMDMAWQFRNDIPIYTQLISWKSYMEVACNGYK